MAALALGFAVFFHLPVLKTVALASAGVAIFYLVLLPLLFFFVARRKNLQGWWRVPFFVLLGNRSVKWYTAITRDYGYQFMNRCRNFHVLPLASTIMKWRNGEDGEDEEWGAGT